ncbi:MAG: ATP-binding cassette domain-containing protein, partial [Desulfobacterales bacterium]
MAQPILTVENIRVRYSGLPVLHGVSIHLDPGETVCVVGANGAGKSTLLRAVMGAQKAFEGRICF